MIRLYASIFLFCTCMLFSDAMAQQVKVGFCLDDYNVDRWYKDRDYFISKVKELGGEALIEVAYSDEGEQLRQAEKLIKQGVKVLVIVPTDAEKAGAIVQLARKTGVKVISYDRMIVNADVDYYVSYDNEKVGALMAEYVVKLKPEGKYAILSGPDSDANAKQYYAGQMKVLQPYIKKKSISLIFDKKVDEWTELEAMITLDEFLRDYTGELDVVLAANDGLASGVLFSLKEHGKSGEVLVTGQDADLNACKAILAKEQIMTIYKPVRPLAEFAATLAVKLARNEQINITERLVENKFKKVPSFLFTPVVVDATNLKSTVVADGHIAEDELN